MGLRGERDGVGACCYVVERLVVVGAASDPVEGGVDEAEVSARVLIGESDDGGPERSGNAGAAATDEDVVLAAAVEGDRNAGSVIGVSSDVGHAPGGVGAVDSGLVAGRGKSRLKPLPPALDPPAEAGVFQAVSRM